MESRLAVEGPLRLGQAGQDDNNTYSRELDVETLVWTRGPNFPLCDLASRLMCPRCRSRRVAVLFDCLPRPVGKPQLLTNRSHGA